MSLLRGGLPEIRSRHAFYDDTGSDTYSNSDYRIKNDGIRIWGNPNLKLEKNYIIKDYLKDHRIFMVSTIAALTLGGNWKIYDTDCFKTSFPKYLKILNSLGANIK